MPRHKLGHAGSSKRTSTSKTAALPQFPQQRPPARQGAGALQDLEDVFRQPRTADNKSTEEEMASTSGRPFVRDSASAPGPSSRQGQLEEQAAAASLGRQPQFVSARSRFRFPTAVQRRLEPPAKEGLEAQEPEEVEPTRPVSGQAPGQSSGGERQTLRDELLARGIELTEFSSGQHYMLCPKCEGGRTAEQSFGILVNPDCEVAKWKCHRATCGFKGVVNMRQLRAAERRPKLTPNLAPLTGERLHFFRSRGISRATLEAARVAQETLSSTKGPVIAFPYYRGGDIVNIKYRRLPKGFWQVPGAEKVLFGLDNLAEGASGLVLVEGEMDKLSLDEAGVPNALSVPDGAPAKALDRDPPPPGEDVKYSYLWNCRHVLDGAQRIVLATDNDAPGRALAADLARRLGPERCWQVVWPIERKDANEVLMKDGADELRRIVAAARPFPISGLIRVEDMSQEVLHDLGAAPAPKGGIASGIPALDRLYRVDVGQVTVIAGLPGSGLSQLTDALLLRLARQHGAAFAIASLRCRAHQRAASLVQQVVGLQDHGRMPAEDEVANAFGWMNEHIVFLQPEHHLTPTMEEVLRLAEAAIVRHDVRGLVVDSHSRLARVRDIRESHGTAANLVTAALRDFARHHSIHIWLLADYLLMAEAAPLLDRADTGILLRRISPAAVQLSVMHVQNEATAARGDCLLEYDPHTNALLDARSLPIAPE